MVLVKKTVRSSYGHIEYEAGIKSYPNYQYFLKEGFN